jgi:hypothetical protein
MTSTGTVATRLVILRGNSGSGKSTVARAVQAAGPGGEVALLSQDVVRREVLRVHDAAGNPSVDLLDLVARFALGRGLSLVLEGILHPPTYAAMLTGLAADHVGCTLGYSWDRTFEETLRRHGSREEDVDYGEAEMRRWWLGRGLIEGLDERSIDAAPSVDAAVTRILTDAGWTC